jgi:ketosteroid isomerase-like protein
MKHSKALSPRAVVEATHRAVLDGDADGFALRFAEDAVLEFPFSAESALPARIQGREAIRGAAATLGQRFHRDGRRLRRFEKPVVHETTDPEVLVLEFEAVGEPGNAASARLPDIQLWRVREGEVLSMRDYLGARSPAAPVHPVEVRVLGGSTWG